MLAVRDFVDSPEQILGSPRTKHGEIAEHVHVSIQRAYDLLHRRRPPRPWETCPEPAPWTTSMGVRRSSPSTTTDCSTRSMAFRFTLNSMKISPLATAATTSRRISMDSSGSFRKPGRSKVCPRGASSGSGARSSRSGRRWGADRRDPRAGRGALRRSPAGACTADHRRSGEAARQGERKPEGPGSLRRQRVARRSRTPCQRRARLPPRGHDAPVGNEQGLSALLFSMEWVKSPTIARRIGNSPIPWRSIGVRHGWA